jgi:hypothetical protein
MFSVHILFSVKTTVCWWQNSTDGVQDSSLLSCKNSLILTLGRERPFSDLRVY